MKPARAKDINAPMLEGHDEGEPGTYRVPDRAPHVINLPVSSDGEWPPGERVGNQPWKSEFQRRGSSKSSRRRPKQTSTAETKFSRRSILFGLGGLAIGGAAGHLTGSAGQPSLKPINKFGTPVGRGPELSPQEIYERIKDSVVVIEAGTHFGTGFCIDVVYFSNKPMSIVVTADHVTGGQEIRRLCSGTLKGEITAKTGETGTFGESFFRNGYLDLSSFTTRLDLKPVLLAEGLPEIGETVYTLGHPRHQNFTFSSGIVSAYLVDENSRCIMQITAPISGGSSGGPVVNSSGEVVGLVQATEVNAQNINYVLTLPELLAQRERMRFLARTV